MPLYGTDDIIKPADCVYAFAIPINEEQFYTCKKDGNKNFVKSCCPVFAKYNFEIITPFNKMRLLLNEAQLTILEQLDFQQFKALFSGRFKAIIVIAHCEDNMIEFHDGFHNSEEILAAIPDTFIGVLDLGSCSPINISELIDEYKPTCNVRFSRKPLSIGLWLYYYRSLFEYMSSNNVSYVQAYRDVTIEFINQLKMKNERK